MKRMLFLVLPFMRLNAMELQPLAPQEQHSTLSGELKEYAIEISIASLYLAGGVPFLSDTTRWACDISGSLLWLTTAIYACTKTILKRKRKLDQIDIV